MPSNELVPHWYDLVHSLPPADETAHLMDPENPEAGGTPSTPSDVNLVMGRTESAPKRTTSNQPDTGALQEPFTI